MSEFIPACRVLSAICGLTIVASMPWSTGAYAQDASEGGSIGGSLAPSSPSNGAAGSRHRGHAARPAGLRRSTGGRAGGETFDGTWNVSAGGSCAAAGSSQVLISNGRIIGPNGSGTVSRSGAVQTRGSFNGLTVTARGRISGTSASGTYTQSDGCTGPWSGYKL